MRCLIYMHSPSGTAHPWALYIYIRQCTLACVITYTCIPIESEHVKIITDNTKYTMHKQLDYTSAARLFADWPIVILRLE